MSTRQGRRPQVKPSVVPLVIGGGLAVMTVVLGLIAWAAPTEDSSGVQRQVFYNIPSAGKGLFYAILPLFFLAAGWFFYQRVQNWQRGQPDRRTTTAKNVKPRLADFRACVYMQTPLLDPAAGIMHSLIYFPF